MAKDFMTDDQMAASQPDVNDMDPQSALAMPGMKKVASAVIDDVPNKPGDDSIQPDYNSPIEAVGFAAPKAAISATEALANGMTHSDFAKIVGNEVGALGRGIKKELRVVPVSSVTDEMLLKSPQHADPSVLESLGMDDTFHENNNRLSGINDINYAVKDKKIIGHIAVDDEGSVKSVHVDPEHRGKGVAQTLYEDYFKKNGSLSSDEPAAMEPEAKALWDKLKTKYPKNITKDSSGWHYKGDPSILANEVGTLGHRQKAQDYAGKLLEQGRGADANPGALQRIAKAVGLSQDAKAEDMIELASAKLKDGHPDLKQSDLVLLRQKMQGKRNSELSTTVDDTRKKFAEGGLTSSAPSSDFMTDEQMNQMSPQSSGPDFMTDDQMHEAHDKYTTPGQQVMAGAEAVGRGLLGPVAPIAQQVFNKAVFNQEPEETNKNIRGREEANPGLAKATEAATVLGSMYVGIGEAGAIAKAGQAVFKIGEASSLAAKVGNAAARGAVENMLLQGSDEASKMIIQDPHASSQTAITNIGLAGLLGGGLGGTLETVAGAFKPSGSKVSQMLEDFKGRIDEHMQNPDPTSALHGELTDHYNNIKSIADDVYGPQGLKAQDIEKSMPEMSEKISNQATGVSDSLSSKLETMSKDSYKFPPRLTARLASDVEAFQTAIGNAKSPGEIFNATQDLKQTLQGYSKYDKFVKPTDEAYDFVRESKKLAFDLRNQLEDKAVWGKAAERQQQINKAFTDFKPALKDFESKFTEEVGGEKLVSPGKVQSYLNSVGKASGEVKKSMLGSFLDESERYAKVLSDSHANLGIDSPMVHSPLNIAWSTLKRKTTGAKMADIFINKGLTDAGGKSLGAAAGAAIGHGVGVGKEIGALIGAHALGPFFSSVLPAIAKPMLKLASNREGFQEAASYSASVAKGEKLVDKTIKNLFKEDSISALPPSAIPSDKDTSKLEKVLAALRLNSNSLIDSTGSMGHYLPDHATSLTATATNATNFLNNQAPNSTPGSPMDSAIKVPAYQKSDYNRLLKIAQQPLMIVEHIKRGTLNYHDVQAVQTMYPNLYGKLVQKMSNEIIAAKDKQKAIPYKIRLGMSLFMGQPLDSTMTPMSIISTQKATAGSGSQQQPQGKPPAASSTKELTKAPAANRTPGQARQYNQQTKE